jgi:hypothetical protein
MLAVILSESLRGISLRGRTIGLALGGNLRPRPRSTIFINFCPSEYSDLRLMYPNLTQTHGELQVQTLRRIVTATDLETAKSMAEATLGRFMQIFAETV